MLSIDCHMYLTYLCADHPDIHMILYFKYPLNDILYGGSLSKYIIVQYDLCSIKTVSSPQLIIQREHHVFDSDSIVLFMDKRETIC